ncbi:hypothetical protein C1H46_028972 [Malus baccata]|uniref:Auxin-responsive protein n=1 Tax=Malus baccata TaxID=106549 RepID=A0A540LGJ2_MALBA|nr:hypothetical protein C1H46_028972 [Malus baccata]
MMSMLGVERDLNLRETELCLGLPGGGTTTVAEPETAKTTGKRGFSETIDLKLNLQSKEDLNDNVKNIASKDKNNFLSGTKDPSKPPAKAQVVGWPPVRSYRKNIMAQKNTSEEKTKKASGGGGCTAAFVKVCMDGAPYLRKVDLKMYKSYEELSNALAKMFSSFTTGYYGTQGMIDFMNESKLMDLLNSSEYVPTYEDKDGDWMLVGDVPWGMLVDSCKRLRIMKGSEAIGLGFISSSRTSAFFSGETSSFTSPPFSTPSSSLRFAPANLRMVRILTLATASKPTTTPLREPRGIMKPREVSPKMQALMGAPEISRTQDLKQIWAHIKQNNLQVYFAFFITL